MVGRHANSSTRHAASVRGVPLVGGPGPGDGRPRHGGRSGQWGVRTYGSGRRHGIGALSGLALLAAAVFGAAGLQPEGAPEPPVLVGTQPAETWPAQAGRP